MTPVIIDELRRMGVVPGIGPGTQVSALKMRSSTLPGGAFVSLLFVGDEASPSYVLRSPRTPALPDRINANYSNLKAIAGVAGLAGSVPSPVFSGSIEDVTVTVETYIDGLALSVAMVVAQQRGMTDVGRLLEAALSRGVSMHEATWSEADPGFELDRRSELKALTEGGFLAPAELDRLSEETTHAISGVIPFSRIHGDFNPNNLVLLERPGAIGVVDWEHSRIGCAPWDLFMLVTISLLFGVDAAERERRRAALWDGTTEIGRPFRQALARYTESFDLDEAQFHRLYVLYLLHQSAGLMRIPGWETEPMADLWRGLLVRELEFLRRR